MTTSSTGKTTPSVLERLRMLFGGQPADGRLGSRIKAAQALDLVRESGATVLDVREKSEWKTGHVAGAIHVALGNIDQAPKRLHQDRPVIVMCASGMRSRTAAKHLRALGYDAASLSGGMSAWQRAGGAVRR